jgi:hypothetical protein
MDFVACLVQQLVEQVQNAVAKPINIEPDEYYGEVVPCFVDILAVLHELTGTAAIPPPEVVAEWKNRRSASKRAWPRWIMGRTTGRG